jgi:hypothetical protein
MTKCSNILKHNTATYYIPWATVHVTDTSATLPALRGAKSNVHMEMYTSVGVGVGVETGNVAVVEMGVEVTIAAAVVVGVETGHVAVVKVGVEVMIAAAVVVGVETGHVAEVGMGVEVTIAAAVVVGVGVVADEVPAVVVGVGVAVEEGSGVVVDEDAGGGLVVVSAGVEDWKGGPRGEIELDDELLRQPQPKSGYRATMAQ